MLTMVVSAFEPVYLNVQKQASELIIETEDLVLTHAKSLYADSSHLNMGASFTSKPTPLFINNYRQSRLNTEYNYPDGTPIDMNLRVEGTCVQVAMAIQMEYMLSNSKLSPLPSTPVATSIHDHFSRAIECADAEDGWTRTGGTPFDLILPIVNRHFSYYSPTYKGDESTLLMKSKIEKSYEAGIPCFVRILNHEVVGVGMFCVTITYQTKGLFGIMTNHTKDVWYVVISDGLHDSAKGEPRWTYIPMDDVTEIIVPEL